MLTMKENQTTVATRYDFTAAADFLAGLNDKVVTAIAIMNRPKARQREDSALEVWQTLRECHYAITQILQKGGER